jgi:hypothetical protein
LISLVHPLVLLYDAIISAWKMTGISLQVWREIALNKSAKGR